MTLLRIFAPGPPRADEILAAWTAANDAGARLAHYGSAEDGAVGDYARAYSRLYDLDPAAADELDAATHERITGETRRFLGMDQAPRLGLFAAAGGEA